MTAACMPVPTAYQGPTCNGERREKLEALLVLFQTCNFENVRTQAQ